LIDRYRHSERLLIGELDGKRCWGGFKSGLSVRKGVGLQMQICPTQTAGGFARLVAGIANPTRLHSVRVRIGYLAVGGELLALGERRGVFGGRVPGLKPVFVGRRDVRAEARTYLRNKGESGHEIRGQLHEQQQMRGKGGGDGGDRGGRGLGRLRCRLGLMDEGEGWS
jgi:hypothetical protein